MKKIISFLLLFFITSILSSCNFSDFSFSVSKYANSIYDDDSKMVSSVNTHNILNLSEKGSFNDYEVTAKFEGMDTIWSYNSDEDSKIDINYLLNTTKGKAKLVFINGNDNVETLVKKSNFSNEKAYESSTLDITKGFNRIKLVGYKSNIHLNINCNEGKLKGLGS